MIKLDPADLTPCQCPTPAQQLPAEGMPQDSIGEVAAAGLQAVCGCSRPCRDGKGR